MATNKTKPPKPLLPHIEEAISTKWKLLIASILAIVAMAIYSPSVNFDYVYDDDAVIKDNRYVQQGLDGLPEIWTTSYFKGYDETINARAFRPVPLTTLALEYEIWGLNPRPNHVMNLLFYGLTAFFLFLFLSKLLRNHHPALPIIACLLFLLHPIHIEVVANIKSRDTMLGFLNEILAGWLLLKYLDSRKILPLVLSVFFYLIALFSKEQALAFLAVIPMMVWFFRACPLKKTVLTLLPYLAAAVLFLIIRSNIIGGLNAGVALTEYDNSLLAADGLGQRVASNILVLGHYLWMAIFPHPLISDYGYITIPLVDWDDWRVWAALLANLGLVVFALNGLKDKRLPTFAILFYFAAVSIFTSIIVTNVSAYNDRFLYSPVLGICLLAAWLILKLVKKEEPGTAFSTKAFFQKNFTVVAIVAVLSAVEVVKIASHLPVWKNRYLLFESDVKLAPNNARAHKNHGGSLARIAVDYQKGNRDSMRHYANLAVGELQTALSIYNNIPTGHIHLGNMYIILGQYSEAEASMKTALSLAPQNYFARTSLANIYYRTNRFMEAVQLIENIDVNLRKAGDYEVLAKSYDALGQPEKAREYWKMIGR